MNTASCQPGMTRDEFATSMLAMMGFFIIMMIIQSWSCYMSGLYDGRSENQNPDPKEDDGEDDDFPLIENKSE